MATMTQSNPKTFVDDLIKQPPVLVISKSYCPYCKKAKAALAEVVPQNDIVVVELDQRQDGDAIQDYMQEKTGARSVPRVFVKGKFLGGGDDTVAKAQSGELKNLLA